MASQDTHDFQRVLKIGTDSVVLVQLWVYRCIQEFMFLQPCINMHPLYPQARAAMLADKSKRILVMPLYYQL